MSWKIALENAPAEFGDTITLSAVKPNWNDFGFNYHAAGSFLYNGAPFHISLFFIPLELRTVKPYSHLSKAPHGNLNYYTSILAQPELYKSLAEKLSRKHLEFLLANLHDISYERSIGNMRSDEFIQSEPFRLGVLRYSDAYLSLVNGFDSAYTSPPVLDAKTPFSLSTLLPGTENFLSFDVGYRHHEHFDDRVHCLIGLNGAGKTNLLVKLITAAALECNNHHKFRPSTELYSNSQTTIINEDVKLDLPKGFTFNRVVSYYSDPSSTLPRHSSIGAFEYHAFNTTSNAEKKGFHENLSYLLVTLLRIEDDAFEHSKWTILTNSLSSSIPMNLLAIPVTGNCPDYCCVEDANGRKWSYISQMSNEQRSLEILGTIDTEREPSFLSAGTRRVIALSSGQRSMFQFALHFLTHAGYGTLLIIDEPETYLHPNLVSDYMMLLYQILEYTSSVAIIATHSAYVVREVPTHCVHILERKNNKATINKPYLQTLGANVSEISLAVFGDSTVDAYHRRVTELISKTNMPFEQIIHLYKDIFNIEMLMEIKDRISNPSGISN